MKVTINEYKERKSIELKLVGKDIYPIIFELLASFGYLFNKKTKIWFKPLATAGDYGSILSFFKNKEWELSNVAGVKEKSNNQTKPKSTTKTIKKDNGLAGTMSIAELSNRPFKPYKMPQKWTELIGNFELPIQILVHGKGGRGKSGMALSFANDFSQGGKKVLYASKEQYYNPTLPHLIRAVGINTANKNITIAPEYLTEHYNPSMFDLVVLDSKDSFGLKDPEEFEKLIAKYPKTSFMLLSQSTKDDEFRGAGNWQNVVDTILHAHEKGKIKTGEKNRWGASGEITLFEANEHETQN